MNFKAFSNDLEINAVVKSASDVKDLFKAYNIQIEEEEEEDEYDYPYEALIEPIVEMTCDDSNEFNSDHDIAKRQLDQLEAKNPRIDFHREFKHEQINNPLFEQYKNEVVYSAPPPIEKSCESLDGSVTSEGVEENGDGPCTYKCDLCNTGFRVKHSITKHKRVVHGMHQFSCMFCQQSYPLKRNLLDHILTHRGPHGFKCDICNKVRPNYISIQRHIKTHAEKSIPCTKCSAWFKTKWELRSHAIQHQDDRNFECKTCQLTFVNPTKLRLHMARHNSYRPYSCDLCGKDFSAQGNLTNHRRLHFEDKPFKCQYCSLTFLSAAARKKHIPVHERECRKPYECSDCKKKYTSTTSLAVHRLKFHSGTRVFDCHYCKLKFKSKKEISEHVAGHAVERPYSCKSCPCRYKNKRELRRHEREKGHSKGGRLEDSSGGGDVDSNERLEGSGTPPDPEDDDSRYSTETI